MGVASWNKRHRLLVAWTLRSGVVLVAVVVVSIATLGDKEEAVLPGAEVDGLTSMLTRKAGTDDSTIRFEDRSTESGITFRHFPAQRSSLLPEDMGSGVACGDYDGDGLTDVFLVNFAGPITEPLPGAEKGFTAQQPEHTAQHMAQGGGNIASCRLYRNVGDFRFEDVTESSGLGLIAFAMGAAWGDYDNDGDLDLYVTAYGNNALFANDGHGRFVDVTAETGTQDDRFSTGCSWSDYDRDGDVDLYVSNYVAFEFREADRDVTTRQYGSEQPYTLNPSAYAPQPNSLFRNDGDGRFTNVADTAGVANPTGRSLAISWADLSNDGLPDLYIANDVSNNGVYRNRGDGTFEDVGPASLAGDYRGAMGLAVDDFDGDQDLDLLVTHWIAQENALFRNMLIDPLFDAQAATRLWFLDSADELGLGQQSLDTVGWATGFVDFDNDGKRDLWVVNGSTFATLEDRRVLIPQRSLIFRNRGRTGYIEVGATTCKRLSEPMVGRGGAMADFDRDGRVDLIIQQHGGAPVVLRNTSDSGGHWLAVRLRQNKHNRFALGARVYVVSQHGTQMVEIGASPSYLSQDDVTGHFGLGPDPSIEAIRIVWPDGSEERHDHPKLDQTITYQHDPKYPV